jgi:phosphotransferase system  glucose/maltose/N-acetylglucosamine-specific IIC component
VIKNIYSPFDCRNEQNDFILNYKLLKKNSKISFIIIIFILFIYFCFIVFEIYLAKTKCKKDKISHENKLKQKKEEIKRKIKNEITDSEMRINVD